jgi:predicted metal-dependent hydrolase
LKSPSFKILQEKEVNIPKQPSIKQIKVDIDDKHPEGIMTEAEYDIFIKSKKELLITGIDKVLSNKYVVKVKNPENDTVSEKEVLGKDLPKELLQSKIESVSGAVTQVVKNKMKLTKVANKTVAEELDGNVSEWIKQLNEQNNK